jgi:hypothetical protein
VTASRPIARRVAVVVVALGVLAVAAPVGSQARTVVAKTARVSSAAAYGGRVVWTAFDPAHHRVSLRWRSSGSTHVVPGSTQPEGGPIAVGLGPDTSGKPTAVFVRCIRHDTECRLYRYRLGDHTSRLIRAATVPAGYRPTAPSLWRHRIAYALAPTRRAHTGNVYILRLGAPRAGRVDGGTSTGLSGGDQGGYIGATGTALHGNRLLFTWEGPSRPCGSESDPLSVSSNEIWRARLGDPARRVAVGCPGDPVNTMSNPSIGELGDLIIYRDDQLISHLGRLDPTTGHLIASAPLPNEQQGDVQNLTQDGRTIVYIQGKTVYRDTPVFTGL